MTIGTAEDSAAQLPPFIFDQGSEVQIVLVPVRLVKPTCSMTRSATDALFRIMNLKKIGAASVGRL